MNIDYLSQGPYKCRLEWGYVGIERAAARKDCVVLVDLLSFSTTVTWAVSRGAIIYPCSEKDDCLSVAKRLNAELGVARLKVPDYGRFSLSPGTFDSISPGQRVVLPSLNGSTCSVLASGSNRIMVGSLLNASAVSRYLNRLLNEEEIDITVVCCGEREKGSKPDLRVAIEDYLGAGAILNGVEAAKSPEAQACEAAFEGSSERLVDLIWNSVSGRELREVGFEADVKFASQIDLVDTVPILADGAFVAGNIRS